MIHHQYGMQLNSYVVMLNLRIIAQTSLDNCCYNEVLLTTETILDQPYLHLSIQDHPLILDFYEVSWPMQLHFGQFDLCCQHGFIRFYAIYNIFAPHRKTMTWKKSFWWWLGDFWSLIKFSRVFVFKTFIISKSNFFQIFDHNPSPIS